MNGKVFLYGSLVLLLLCSFIVISDMEESDAVTEYPVTIFYHPNATIVFDGTTVTSPNSTEPYGYGDPITITATLATGYTFDHWHGYNVTEGEPWDTYSTSPDITISGNVVTFHTWCYGEEEFTLYLSGGTPTYHTITFQASPSGWGTVEKSYGWNAIVEYGTQFAIYDDMFWISIYDYAVAEPANDSGGWRYIFDSWSWGQDTGVVTSDMTVTAYFDRVPATYNVKFTAGAGGTVSSGYIYSVPYNSAISVNNNQVTINGTTVTATPSAGYVFSHWSNITGTVTNYREITANFVQAYTVTISYNSSYGSVSQSTFNNIPLGTSIYASGNTLYVGTATATASPRSGTTLQTFSFDGWTIPHNTVQGNETITATFSAHYRDFPVTVFYNPNATIYADYELVPQAGWSELTAYAGVVHLSATIDDGYAFDYWYGNNLTEGEDWTADENDPYVTVNGQTVTYEAYCYGEEEFTLILTGVTPVTYTVTFQVSPSGYGSLSSYSVTADYGDVYSYSDNVFSVGGTTVTASPAPDDLYYTYSFDSWSTQASGTVTSDMTVTAYFTREAIVYEDGVYWSNDNYNGRINILFKFDASDNKTHTLDMDLLIGNVGPDQTTTWVTSPYSLNIDLSYPSLSVSAALIWGGQDISNTVSLGNWSTFILSIDTDKGKVEITPIKTFESFTSYTTYSNQTRTVLDFSAKITGAAVHDIVHTESDSGTNSPRFSVVGTSVFLNTFGVVLYNPTINLYDYFPQYNAIRVNFYSFALYGESITINGHTWNVDGSKITIQYVSDGSEHYLPGVMPNATIQTRTFELTNIYVTYQDGHCYLTFVNDRFTLDLGAHTANNETISMVGLWFFATMVYEPYTAYEKELSDWKTIPETNGSQMVLMFVGILIVAGAALAIHVRKSGLGIIDLMIVGGAAVVGLLMLG